MSRCSLIFLCLFLFAGFTVLLYQEYDTMHIAVLATVWSVTATATSYNGHGDPSRVNIGWHAPRDTNINDLVKTVNGSGTYGFFYNSSSTPVSVPYSTYNWCNMPHVRPQEYVRAPAGYELRYIELIHRHHKRTPYASNTFPKETSSWYCDDESLYYYGAPQPENTAAAVSWQLYTSPNNPLAVQGFNGTCQFPQITAGGLLDSRQHGKDLFKVYHDLLNFLPPKLDADKIVFRVTNNQITSQVASQVIYGMYATTLNVRSPVLVQPPSVDSLEPAYSCPAGSALFSSYGVGSTNANWTVHLDQSRQLLTRLDTVSGIDGTNTDWHKWFDHYYDNLSARLCHDKPLPCKASDPTLCVTMEDAEAVFRRGQYEYSFIYRDSPQSLQASSATFGIWLAELAGNLKSAAAARETVIWRHNIAHDGSISRLLSILQVDVMVWPGMGSEVVFELYSRQARWYLRVLWKGQVLTSSNPSLGELNMIPLDTFFAYIDGLVGRAADKIINLCGIH